MERLNLPTYSFIIKSKAGGEQIFDRIRRKYVALTPEEWVRQHFVRFMVEEKEFPEALVRVEMSLEVNRMSRRCDLVFFDRSMAPRLIVECKSPVISITQKVFNQVAAYNLHLRVDYLVVTNGLKHFACRMDYEQGSYAFLKDIPSYSDITPSEPMH